MATTVQRGKHQHEAIWTSMLKYIKIFSIGKQYNLFQLTV